MLKSKGIMRREVDGLVASGYIVLLGLFVVMIILCFIWGLWEYKKPKDPGPLFIDLDRTIDKKSEARGRREVKAAASELTQWNPKMDELIKERFEEVSVDDLSIEIERRLGVHIPANIILRRAAMLGLVEKALTKLTYGQKPKYLESVTVWMQGAETIRVRGDVRIPNGEVIPYNMIVEGNLTSQDDVTFHGGLHVKGQAIIGRRNRLEKSIVCQEELILLEDVIVLNSIDCDGLVFIKEGVKVGVGVDGGAITSASTICLEKAEGPLQIYSREGVRIGESLKEVIPEDMKQIIEVKAV